MNWNPDNERQSDELDWQAFQYVANEMNAVQRREFEERMAEEQEVRDAIVRVMEVGELTYRCFQATSGKILRPVADQQPARVTTADPWIDRRNPLDKAGRKSARTPGILFAAAVGLFLLASTWAVMWRVASPSDGMTAMNLEVADVWSSLEAWEPGETWTLSNREDGFSESESWLSLDFQADSEVVSGVEADMGATGPATASSTAQIGSEPENWMLVALIDLQGEEVRDSQ